MKSTKRFSPCLTAGVNILISLIITYLTLFIQYLDVPIYKTAEFAPQFVLVAGFPFHFLEDNLGVSPVNSLSINPLVITTGLDIFLWQNFLIDWSFWLGCSLLGQAIYRHSKVQNHA